MRHSSHQRAHARVTDQQVVVTPEEAGVQAQVHPKQIQLLCHRCDQHPTKYRGTPSSPGHLCPGRWGQ
eukprot:CAMPEP_0183607980 /NCGR_PEP_ID=MMETSP0371-20130417/183731_1 /TAXON_ID=268820 /ORGANISM="Peridinium aciculiferum, Strain PAER-2" /LENGTH=67 /DNA_ID=CAMNT_0025820105 /DNA_START=529 /DNA_END=729 /DNA_ORIENTATION=+